MSADLPGYEKRLAKLNGTIAKWTAWRDALDEVLNR